MSKLRDILIETVKESIAQEPNPQRRQQRKEHVQRSIDATFNGERRRERKR